MTYDLHCEAYSSLGFTLLYPIITDDVLQNIHPEPKLTDKAHLLLQATNVLAHRDRLSIWMCGDFTRLIYVNDAGAKYSACLVFAWEQVGAPIVAADNTDALKDVLASLVERSVRYDGMFLAGIVFEIGT